MERANVLWEASRARALRPLLLTLLLCGLPGVARGDGAPVVPARLLQHFTEQSQVAVVEVNPHRTVRVDLFISLTDGSGSSHSLQLFLPLQSLPKEFEARETPAGRFEDAHLTALDAIRAAAIREEWDYWHGDAPLSSLAGAVFAGPIAASLELLAAASGRQVHVVTYADARPDRDLAVLIQDHGRSRCVQEAVGRTRRRVGWYVGSPLLGLLSWCFADPLLWRPKTRLTRHELRRLLLPGWLLGFLVSAAALTGLAATVLLLAEGTGGLSSGMGLLVGLPLAAGLFLVGAVWAAEVYRRRAVTDGIRFWATASLSTVLYLALRHLPELL